MLASNKINSAARAYIDHNEYDYVKEDVDQDLVPGVRVLLEADGQGGSAGDIYEYAGDVDLTPAELATTDFSNSTLWKKIIYPADVGTVNVDGSLIVTASDNAGIYANSKIVSSSITTNDGGAAFLQENINDLIPADFLSSEGSCEIEFGERVRLTDDYDSSLGAPGTVYRYMGITATLDLSGTDYTDLGLWKPVPETNLVPQGYNLSGSSALALGGLVVMNDVRSDVDAFLDGAEVTAAAVTVTAVENATILAIADSAATASGGSAFGTGTVIAVNATIATNVVLSGANASITGSAVTTTAGDLAIEARNTS